MISTLALAFFVVGLVLGTAHVLSLRRNVRAYIEGGARQHAIALHLARLAVIAIAWLVVARLGGAVGLLAAFAGFIVARPLVTARVAGP